MDYILYTSNATYWNTSTGAYEGPIVEICFFKDADQTVVLEEIFGCNDSMQSQAGLGLLISMDL